MKTKRYYFGKSFITLILLSLILGYSCKKSSVGVEYDFNKINDRIWIGEEFWSVPIEDWRLNNGRIEFTGEGQQASLSVLPYILSEKNDQFRISLDMGVIKDGDNPGSAGLTIGVTDAADNDFRAAIYFGKGIRLGINTGGFAFLEQKQNKLPEGTDLQKLHFEIEGKPENGEYNIKFSVLSENGEKIADLAETTKSTISGIVQIISNFRNSNSKNNGPSFWFDNLELDGPKFLFRPENRFGPVLWTMYTLSRKTLKLTAQLPPLGEKDIKTAELQIMKDDKWQPAGSETMDTDARTVTFRADGWDETKETEYRVLFPYNDVFGKHSIYIYNGIIRKDPADRPLMAGVLTCQFGSGFPYSPLVKNLGLKKPDLLYFSGDQIYESNGGYPIKRTPEEMAILNYLGKWYMFGWAFGDLMRSTPVICTPDDHDVFQGNLWGGGGIAKNEGSVNNDDLTGFAQTTRMVNAVNKTNCAHLPDPFDPSTFGSGITPWYTSLVYGRISFAIISDRVFKSGPDQVADWEGRKDWIKGPLKNPSVINKPGLVMLGARQENFLKEWVRDWDGADMKVLLSQTIFANVATHHGQYNNFLYGDMDSGGWPKEARDKAVSIIRKGFAFHINGDQHVPSIVQYGIDSYRDAGWSFCPPAISTGYSRWFRPDELKYPVHYRPAHGNPNTGEYTDAFGNKNYVYAIGNPGDFRNTGDRYKLAQDKSSGFGFVIFDQKERNITMEAWRFLADINKNDSASLFPGWPQTISQFDNYGRVAKAWLPKVVVKGPADPVIEVTNQETDELEYAIRIKGSEHLPGVFSDGTYSIRIGYPEKGTWKEFTGIKSSNKPENEILTVDFMK